MGEFGGHMVGHIVSVSFLFLQEKRETGRVESYHVLTSSTTPEPAALAEVW